MKILKIKQTVDSLAELKFLPVLKNKIKVSTKLMINADIITGIQNLRITFLFTSLPTGASLKMLLRRCTITVSTIAISIRKNIANTGVRIVPNPNPTKKFLVI